MSKQDYTIKKELSLKLFLEGKAQNKIAVKVGVTEKTLSGWVKTGRWEQKRAELVISNKSITDRLKIAISKLVEQLDIIVEGAKVPDDLKFVSTIADQMCKFASTIEKLEKKQITEIEAMELFMDFNSWIEQRYEFDPKLQAFPNFIKLNSEYQQLFINEKF